MKHEKRTFEDVETVVSSGFPQEVGVSSVEQYTPDWDNAWWYSPLVNGLPQPSFWLSLREVWRLLSYESKRLVNKAGS